MQAARLVPRRWDEAATTNSQNRNGEATVPVECSPARVLASHFPQGHARNRPGGRRRDARHFAHLEFAALFFRARNAYPDRDAACAALFAFRFSIFGFPFSSLGGEM